MQVLKLSVARRSFSLPSLATPLAFPRAWVLRFPLFRISTAFQLSLSRSSASSAPLCWGSYRNRVIDKAGKPSLEGSNHLTCPACPGLPWG
jgi:hypothetical protein